MAELPHELYSAQCSSSIGFSNVDFTARYSQAGQRVLTNADLGESKNLVFGPDSVLGLLEDQKLEWVSANNNNSGYLESLELHLRHFANCAGLSPKVFMRGGWSTGVSKMLDAHDRDGVRQSHRLALEEAENSFLRALRLVLNFKAGEDRWSPSYSEVSHFQSPIPSDPFARAQSLRFSMEDGLTSPSEILATERLITREAARELVDRNLEEYRAVRDRMKDEEGAN